MRATIAGRVASSGMVLLLLLAAAGAALGFLAIGCGGAAGSTASTAAPTTNAGAPTTSTTSPGVTAGTTLNPSSGTTAPPATGATATSDPNQPTTTVFTGSTLPGGGSRMLAYVGLLDKVTFENLRQLVIDAAEDGQKVLDGVAGLSAGPDVSVGMAELDAVSGIGFTAGAGATQAIAVVSDRNGRQYLVFAFTVPKQPEKTTIVGFDRETHHVGLVDGPLAVTDATRNVTTIPGQ
jgi:hypothetical protein